MKSTPRLVVITPGDAAAGRDLRPWLEALANAEVPTVVLREPRLTPREVLHLVLHGERQGLEMVVHLRCPGALQTGRPVHAPGQVVPATRQRWSASCHTRDEVDTALAAGARFALLSPVWTPLSKPEDTRSGLGPQNFLDIAAGRPVLALGGVTPDRLRALRQAGAHGAAVCGGIFQLPLSAGEQVARQLVSAAYSSGSREKSRSS